MFAHCQSAINCTESVRTQRFVEKGGLDNRFGQSIIFPASGGERIAFRVNNASRKALSHRSRPGEEACGRMNTPAKINCADSLIVCKLPQE